METDNQIALAKTSAENEIETYFQKVLELKRSGEEFPVDLDEVWPLVYPRKDHAVRDLKENFIQDIDYQVLPKNGEQTGRGGHNKMIYKLTVSCMEYFIARKVRPVFEVYRKVFHVKVGLVYQIPQSFSEALMLAAQQAAQLELQQKQLNEAAPKVEYHDQVLQSTSLIPTGQIAKELGMSAVELNRKLSEMKVIYKFAGTWVLFRKYHKQEYTGTKTYCYIDKNGDKQTNMRTLWTEKGRKFIHGLMKG
ncbi:MAG: phage antirepressor KilAC domain-containing protein [Prevotella sp.]|jgi:anti-repressor protein|nr:phage antirepressor KilAC domain-containing protein [Prevotella sp.]